MPKGTMESLYDKIKEIPTNGTVRGSTLKAMKDAADIMDRYEIPHPEILGTIKSLYEHTKNEFTT